MTMQNGPDLQAAVYEGVEMTLVLAVEDLERNPASDAPDTISLDGIMDWLSISDSTEDRDARISAYQAVNSLVEQGRIEVKHTDEHLVAHYGLTDAEMQKRRDRQPTPRRKRLREKIRQARLKLGEWAWNQLHPHV